MSVPKKAGLLIASIFLFFLVLLSCLYGGLSWGTLKDAGIFTLICAGLFPALSC